MELSKMTALEIGRMIKNKEIGVAEVTKQALENIEKSNSVYNAFVTVCPEEALKQAEVEELAKLPSMNIKAAQAVYDFFHH